MRLRTPFLTRYAVVLALLLGLRAALPSLVRHAVNDVLQRPRGLEGRVGDLDLNLWRGAYEIDLLRLEKRQGASREPFFSAARVDLSVHWGELIRGRLVGEVLLVEPVLSIVRSPRKEEEQLGKGTDWRQTLEDLFPLAIDRIEVASGRVRYRDDHAEPPVDFEFQEVALLSSHLTNRPDLRGERLAEVSALSRSFSGGEASLRLAFDPLAEPPLFELDGELANVDVVKLNDFLLAYANVDASRGTFHLFFELAARDGRVTGYFKPFFDGLDLLSWRDVQDPTEALQAFWEGLVALAAEAFEDQENNRLGTRIPVGGRIEDPSLGIWPALVGVFRNAFLAAFPPEIDQSIDLSDLRLGGQRISEEGAGNR